MNTPLKTAVQAVIAEWEEHGFATDGQMKYLCKALADEQAQLGEPVAWVKEDELTDLSLCNGRSIWAESPSIWFDEVPEHLVPVYKHSYPLLASEQAQAVECTSDEWLANCPQSVRDLANKIKQAQAVEPVGIVDEGDDGLFVDLETSKGVVVNRGDKLFTHPAPPAGEQAQAANSRIASLYEELRKATDGGSESMTHDDALKQIAYWRDECSQVQEVEPAKLDKKDRCIDAFGNSMVSVGDHVESDDAIFFVGGISDGGLCSIDKTKPFSAKSGPMSKCVTQGNYAAKAAALSFVYPAPPATGERAELIATLHEFVQAIGHTGAVRSVAMARKAADMLEADAEEIERVTEMAHSEKRFADMHYAEKMAIKAHQVAVPATSAAIKRFEPELYDEDRVRMEHDLDGDWVKYSDFLAQQVAVPMPMTHEQINELMYLTDGKWADADVPMHWARHFARAIEAHHGIGEKP